MFNKLVNLTRIAGPTFWDQGILTFTRLNRIPQVVQHVPNIGLNESFMVFGAFALAFNIVSRWVHR
jgi:ethanolaminephosphotransferase